MYLKELQDKIIVVAKKYADLLGKQIDKVSGDEIATLKDLEEINEGIRTLRYAAETIYKLADAYNTKPMGEFGCPPREFHS